MNNIKKIHKDTRKYYTKFYNEYELRFLQLLLDKKTLENIKHLQQVQPMKKKRVYITYRTRLNFEPDD